jgi:pimeloyl-ACP methyl ester carboxylesterase
VLFQPEVSELSFVHGADRLVGDLVRPPWPGPHPAVVFVEGSGPGGREQGAWPARLAAGGLAVFTYDKPGSGASTGHWTRQSMADRAHETLAAVETVGGHPEVRADAVALLGGSQGGWVAPLAASTADTVAAVVTVAGPGVGVLAQEEYRLAHELPMEGFSARDVDDALGVVRERARRAAAGDDAAEVFAAEAGCRRAPWYRLLAGTTVAELGFVMRILVYDPQPALAALRCPLLAIFGADDRVVPVERSVRAIERLVRDRLVVVFPDADHNARVSTGEPAPGFNELVVGWLRARL